MLRIVHSTMCIRNFLLESKSLGHLYSIICRSKYTRYDLNKIVHLNRENKLLFGPVLKAKDLKPKKRKSKTKKQTVEGISTIVEQAKNFTELPNDSFIENPDDKFKKGMTNSSPKKKNEKKTKAKKSTSTSKIETDNLEVEHESKKSTRAQKDKEVELSLPVFNFLFDFPLDQVNIDSGACLDFNSQVEEFALRSVPTVSRILSQTQSEMARFFLQRWREKSIEELGKDGFYQKQEEIKRDGVNLHACVQQYLSGRDVSEIQIQPRTEGYWESLQPAFQQISNIHSTESEVKHPNLMYRGTYDCVAVLKDTLCVIDWKTSQKPKPLLSNTFDNPLQVVAYMGAINANTDIKQQFGPLTSAAIVIAYPWGEPAHIHLMKQDQCQEYWKQWLIRLNQYWNQVAKEKQSQ